MATLATVLCTSHSPFLYTTPEEWTETREKRIAIGAIRADVPRDSLEVNQQKHRRCMDALQVLRRHLEAARPDVLVVCGDDQAEQFRFSNFPAFAVYVGEAFEGYRTLVRATVDVKGSMGPKNAHTPDHWGHVKANGDLARSIVQSLMEEGFDPAFCTELPRPDDGLGHAIMRPLYYLTPDYQVPVVPVLVNCYFPPQPTGRRCAQLGRTIRKIVEAYPSDQRVAVIGSGGLWHTPGEKDAWLNEEFDRATLAALKKGDATDLAAHFDAGIGEESLLSAETGMRGGVGSGTGETRNWIIAAGVADGYPATVVDYVPVYSSPIGMGFAYWEQI